MKMNRLFVDTSAWIALFNEDDVYHQEAAALWKTLPQERVRVLTNDYVMDETYTHLRRCRNGLRRAERAQEIVEQSKLVDFLEVDAADRQRGWMLFQQYRDKILSFTDCVSFAMMHQIGVVQAFSFDAHFMQVGFVVRP